MPTTVNKLSFVQCSYEYLDQPANAEPVQEKPQAQEAEADSPKNKWKMSAVKIKGGLFSGLACFLALRSAPTLGSEVGSTSEATQILHERVKKIERVLNAVALCVFGGVLMGLGYYMSSKHALQVQQQRVDELADAAKTQFACHPLQNEVVQKIKDILPNVLSTNNIAYQPSPTVVDKQGAIDEKLTERYDAINDAFQSFFDRKELFKDLRIGILGGEKSIGLGKWRKTILQKADEYVKTIDPKENRDAVSNYIRQVVYDGNFNKNLTEYINKWKNETATANCIFPSEKALHFFEKLASTK
jgi:hypothetical protein